MVVAQRPSLDLADLRRVLAESPPPKPWDERVSALVDEVEALRRRLGALSDLLTDAREIIEASLHLRSPDD